MREPTLRVGAAEAAFRSAQVAVFRRRSFHSRAKGARHDRANRQAKFDRGATDSEVHKGDLLAELDKEPYRVAVSEKQAAVDTANADLQAASAAVRAIEAEARSRRWSLQHAVQDVDNQVALLHARIAAVAKSRAALALGQAEFDRAKQLAARSDVSREVYDQRQAELTTAGAELTQGLAKVYQIRVSLGLPFPPEGGGDLGQVPPDLDETFSSVLEAQAALIQSAAQLVRRQARLQGADRLLRCVLGAGGCHGRTCIRRAADETLRRREWRSDRIRVSCCRARES